MSADEAKAYGLVDEVVKSRKDVRADLLPQNSGSVVTS
jgi:enoyl-CoA hydratase/carnithine racemase